MRVLMINTVPTEMNGITKVILNYIESLKEVDWGYVSINVPSQELIDFFELHKVELYTIPGRLRNPINYFFKLIKVLPQYDIVHINGNSATMSMELAAAKLKKIKVRIAHCHSTSCVYRFTDKLLRPIFYNLYTCAFACSSLSGEWLFPQKKYTIIKNAFNIFDYSYDETKRIQLRKKLNIEENQIVIGHVGTMTESKNQLFLIDVFEKLHKINKNIKLLLIGDGPLRGKIENSISEKGISKSVILLGNQNNCHEWYNVFDLFVFPSKFEGLGITLLEAQCNGLPVIAADDRTPSEVNICDNFQFLHLSQGIDLWAEAIKICNTERNTQNIERIEASGYHISVEGRRLYSIYKKELFK